MGESGVVLRGMLASLTSRKGHAFISDCCRSADGEMTGDEVREKYGRDSVNE